MNNNTITGALLGSLVPVVIGLIGAAVYISGLGSDIGALNKQVNDLGALDKTVIRLEERVVGLIDDLGSLKDDVSALKNAPANPAPFAPAETPQKASEAAESGTAMRLPGPQMSFTNGGPWGTWSDPVYCPQGQYVCGLQQKVEAGQGKGDDTAMNAVAFFCCPLDPRKTISR